MQYHKKLITIGAILLLLPIVMAQQIELKSGITPDNPLWGIDVWWDNLKCNTFSKGENQILCKVKVSDERLAEMLKMKDNPLSYNKAYAQYVSLSGQVEEGQIYNFDVKQSILLRMENQLYFMSQLQEKVEIMKEYKDMRKATEDKKTNEERKCTNGVYYDGINNCMPCPSGTACITVCSSGCVINAPSPVECESDYNKLCTMEYLPVCCDGKTYPNQCVADLKCAKNCAEGSCRTEPVEPKKVCSDGTIAGQCSKTGDICRQVQCFKAPCEPILIGDNNCKEEKPSPEPISRCSSDEMCRQKHRFCETQCVIKVKDGIKFGSCNLISKGNYPNCQEYIVYSNTASNLAQGLVD